MTDRTPEHVLALLDGMMRTLDEGEWPALIQRPSWHGRAACRGMGPKAFYPTRATDTGPAQAVCESCPVTTECLADAIERGDHEGVWGGQSAVERRRLRRSSERAA